MSGDDASGQLIAHRTVPRVRRLSFTGVEGLRRFPISGRIEAPDPASFRADVAVADLGTVAVLRLEVTAHRTIVDGGLRSGWGDGLLLVAVERGAVTAVPRHGPPIRLRAGDAVFVARARQLAFRTDHRAVFAISTLPEASLPLAARRLDEPMEFDAGYAERGLIDLETAILLELMGGRQDAPRAELLYEAAVEHIDRHIAEPDLAPPTIAQALGVSLRSLHGAFAGRGVTVARHLRDRRLDLVAEVVRTSARRPSSASLAARFGYAGPDPLTRAFRQRFGHSIVEYRSDGPSTRASA